MTHVVQAVLLCSALHVVRYVHTLALYVAYQPVVTSTFVDYMYRPKFPEIFLDERWHAFVPLDAYSRTNLSSEKEGVISGPVQWESSTCDVEFQEKRQTCKGGFQDGWVASIYGNGISVEASLATFWGIYRSLRCNLWMPDTGTEFSHVSALHVCQGIPYWHDSRGPSGLSEWRGMMLPPGTSRVPEISIYRVTNPQSGSHTDHKEAPNFHRPRKSV